MADVSNHFDGFLTLGSNEEALRACLRWCREPTGAPLVLLGPSGTGKSHLVRAAIRNCRQRLGDHGVERLELESLANRYIDAIRKNRVSRLVAELAGLQALAIEELEYRKGREVFAEFLQRVLSSAGGVSLLLAAREDDLDDLPLGPNPVVVRIELPSADEQRQVWQHCTDLPFEGPWSSVSTGEVIAAAARADLQRRLRADL